MKNVSLKKGLGTHNNPAHVEPPTIPLFKEMFTGKSYEDYGELKLCGDSTFSTSEIYEFMMYLLDHDDPEEFLLFIWNLNMTIVITVTLDMDAKVQYLCTPVHG